MEAERRGDWWERYGGLSGVVAVALWVLGFALFATTGVDGANGARELRDAYGDDGNVLLLAGPLFVLGGTAFLWFLGALRTRLLAAEGAPGSLTAIAYATGIATAVFLSALPLGDVAAALADNDELEPAAAQALKEIGTGAFVGAEFTAVGFLVAVALLILRTHALPRWLAWVSLALGALLLIGPIGWLGLIVGFPLWVLSVSVLLHRSGREPDRPPVATG